MTEPTYHGHTMLRNLARNITQMGKRKPRASTGGERSGSGLLDGQQDRPVFFFMPHESYGAFCQWFRSTFCVSKEKISELVGHVIDEDDPEGYIYFGCAEQFMMYCKAARFRDTDRMARVMATRSPREQKALGKLTVGFTDESWDQVKSQVVEAGNIAKFGQNKHLRDKLLSTGDRMLCEASPKDRVWGIGYRANHAMRFQEDWGENRLGKALMDTREVLRKQLEENSDGQRVEGQKVEASDVHG